VSRPKQRLAGWTLLAGGLFRASAPARAAAAEPRALRVAATWSTSGGRRTLSISPCGDLTYRESDSWKRAKGLPDVVLHGRLTPGGISALAARIEAARFMTLPSDVSTPPFLVDEPEAIVEVWMGIRRHRVRASGLRRATGPDALCFRELWDWINAIAPVDAGAEPVERLSGAASVRPGRDQPSVFQ
jgi:hypothetical protein